MKDILVIVLGTFILILFFGAIASSSKGCSEQEYNIVTFCKDDGEERYQLLKKLGKNGWKYRGPINNNGTDCMDVLYVK
jgi:hypothetical protein